jgi:membrane associated rhomboid family serine protease
MIGASGAVSGVLGAYVLLYPHARVLVAVPLVVVLYTLRLPAILVLGIWFLGQLLSTLAAPTGGGGVAFRAHLGGFVAGLLLIRVFSNQRPSGKLFGR